MSEYDTPITEIPKSSAPSGKLFSALIKAQAAFGTVKKSGSMNYGGSKPFHYATLDDILATVRQALNDNGLYVYQDVRCVKSGAESMVGVKTIVVHESGERLESSELYMPVESGGRGNRAQAFGSARTYACRYSLASFFGIAAEDDTDGNTPGIGQGAQVSAKKPVSTSRSRTPVEFDDVPY